MSRRVEELARTPTPIGGLSLRGRTDPVPAREVTVPEVELARLGLAALGAPPDARLDVVVGGPGLGCTARTALEDPGSPG